MPHREAALAVAAQEGGRLVLFALRNLPDGTQSLEKLEEEGGVGGLWLAGDPLGTGLLGKPDYVPKADYPTLASGGPEGIQRALDVDRPELAVGRGPGDQEGQVHHDIGIIEGFAQGRGVADVTAAVLHLRPAVPRRVERPPGDADDPRHPVVALEQRHQPEPERPGRPRHRHRQPVLAPARQTPTLSQHLPVP